MLMRWLLVDGSSITTGEWPVTKKTKAGLMGLNFQSYVITGEETQSSIASDLVNYAYVWKLPFTAQMDYVLEFPDH